MFKIVRTCARSVPHVHGHKRLDGGATGWSRHQWSTGRTVPTRWWDAFRVHRCSSDNFEHRCYKNYQNRWKFDAVLTKTNLLSFFETRCSNLGHISHRFWGIASFSLFFYRPSFSSQFENVPLGVDGWNFACPSIRHTANYFYKKLSYMPYPLARVDRQTDNNHDNSSTVT